MLEFGILGPLVVVVNGEPRPIGPRKHRILLAALLLRANHPVPIEDLIDRLWPAAPPAGARRTVQAYVMRLRHELGTAGRVIRTCPDAYSITLGPDQLDLDRFVRSTARARASADPAAARNQLRRALGEWRGAPLSDVPGSADVAYLTELRCSAFEDRIELDLRLGPPHSLIAELRALISEHPLREPFWALLIRALIHDGRSAEALATFHEAALVLRDELGIQPGRELRDLHARLLVTS